MEVKTYPLKISSHINTNFRNYALYVLENRGIPSFYDGLTNVQRFILLNASSSFEKTLTLVGSCIKDGYHHGDASLGGAIAKLTRPFGNSKQLLIGDGFFGSAVDNTAASPRYTSVKINPEVSDVIKKNSFLNKRNKETGAWEPLWLDFPIGLSNIIVGIGVGYMSTVLPRSLEDVKDYLNGKRKSIPPKFSGFHGKISKYKELDKSWLIEGVVETNHIAKTVRITELPPIMKYSSFLKKIENISEKYNNDIKITNNSSTNVDIELMFLGTKEEWSFFIEDVQKASTILVTETPVFVKDGIVIEYNKIEDYIDDYKYRIADLKVKRIKYFKNVNEDELLFQIYKEKYLMFMLDVKNKTPHTSKEIDNFIKEIVSGNVSIQKRLESILLRTLSEQELENTKKKIIELKKEIETNNNELHLAELEFSKLEDFASKRGTVNLSYSTKNLLMDGNEIDDIETFIGDVDINEENGNSDTEC